jgi:hypothetical protein
MKKLFYTLTILLAVAPATHTLDYSYLNPVRYIKTDAPLTLEYAKNSALNGVAAGVALHAVPHLCQASGIGHAGILPAMVVAALLAQTCYENYSSTQEQVLCEKIAHTCNSKPTDKAQEFTGLPPILPVIKFVKPEQFKMQDESHRAAATFGGFSTGFLHADAVCRGIAWACS